MTTTPLAPPEFRARITAALVAASRSYDSASPKDVAAQDSLMACAADLGIDLPLALLDDFAPKTGASAHAPIVTAEGDWPGCTGEVRRYPSGAEVCDCGEGVTR
jgi:hypothetical protein